MCYYFFCPQKSLDDDCITELAVHYGKTRSQMEEEISQVFLLVPSLYFILLALSKTKQVEYIK